jgi:hypothetical protein
MSKLIRARKKAKRVLKRHGRKLMRRLKRGKASGLEQFISQG